jgi:hypothetical protein
MIGVCNPTTGVCSNASPLDGNGCNDGDSCTTNDTCRAGVCTGGASSCNQDPPTTTTVSCNPSTASRGVFPTQVATQCTAQVRDAIALGPFATGTVSFRADGAITPFATCTINGSAQVQTCSVIYRTSVIGSHPIVATYGGDATHTTSAGATVFVVTLRLAGLAVGPIQLASAPGADPPLITAALALPGRRSSIYLEGRPPPARLGTADIAISSATRRTEPPHAFIPQEHVFHIHELAT